MFKKIICLGILFSILMMNYSYINAQTTTVESEYNNGPQFANSFVFYDTTNKFMGKIQSLYDIDYVKLNYAIEGEITLYLNVPSSIDFDICIYKDDSIVASSNQGSGLKETVKFLAENGSEYYACIFGFCGTYDTNNYYSMYASINPFIPMALDTDYSGMQSTGEVHTYTYTPDDGLFYSIEGKCGPNVVVTAYNTFEGTVSDSASTSGDISFGFRVTDLKRLIIRVYGSGSYKIKIRKQKSVMYTYGTWLNYADWPDRYIKDDYSNIIKYNNFTDQITSCGNDGHKMIDSEVFLMISHGSSTRMSTINDDHLDREDFTFGTELSMRHNKVSIWVGCNTAGTTNDGSASIAETAFLEGSKTSIGWSGNIVQEDTQVFLKYLYEGFDQGKTVRGAINHASNHFSNANNIVDEIRIFGSEYTIVKSSYTNTLYSIQVPEVVNQSLVDCFSNETKSFDYISRDLAGEGKRYTKTIEGIPTNQFFDIISDKSNNITSIKASKAKITKEEITNDVLAKFNKKISISEMMQSIEHSEVFENNHYDTLIKINGELIPVRVINIAYNDYEGNWNYIVRCFNLINNSLVDYETACIVEYE